MGSIARGDRSDRFIREFNDDWVRKLGFGVGSRLVVIGEGLAFDARDETVRYEVVVRPEGTEEEIRLMLAPGVLRPRGARGRPGRGRGRDARGGPRRSAPALREGPPGRKVAMSGPTSEKTISVRLNIRGAGDDDYGIVRVEVPVSEIDWSLADDPRGDIDIDDIYQVDIGVGTRSDTWDRS